VDDSEVTVMGLGYVGLTTALSFAQAGVKVRGFEIAKEKANQIKAGRVPFFEPGLSELLEECISNGSFSVEQVLIPSSITFIAVGTPSGLDGSLDLSYVREAAQMLGAASAKFEAYQLVVVKSTVTPGTTSQMVKPLVEASSGKKFGKEFGLATNPEFLREGSALMDIREPDRLIIGEYDERSGDALLALYRKVYRDRELSIIRTNLVNAEFIKYASNSFLATKISFANTIADIAARVPDADIKTIVEGMGLDKRIGASFLGAGVGYGGSCFPKDTRALIDFSKKVGVEPVLLSSVENVNTHQAAKAVEFAKEVLGDLKGKKIALLGLSFKPDTDDIREAPSLRIIQQLLDAGVATISVYDPAAMDNVRKIFGNALEYKDRALEAIKGANCCILVTEWREFKELKPEDFASLMRTPVLIDGRRIYDPVQYSRNIKFRAVGLGQKMPN
jgi:UDPglucose 6-dehydrogenase